MHTVWKVSLLGRITALTVIPLIGVLSWFVSSNFFIASLAIIAAAVAAVRFAFRPAVILTNDELIVRNPGGSREMPLGEVVTVGPGYGGLTITTVTGACVVAWAVQKSNLATWTGRRTRADEVAEVIMDASRSSAALR